MKIKSVHLEMLVGNGIFRRNEFAPEGIRKRIVREKFRYGKGDGGSGSRDAAYCSYRLCGRGLVDIKNGLPRSFLHEDTAEEDEAQCYYCSRKAYESRLQRTKTLFGTVRAFFLVTLIFVKV